MISQILLPVTGTLLCYFLFHVVQFLYSELTSPLRRLVGPKSPSLILGNFKQMTGLPGRRPVDLQISELHTSDLKAINYIVTNSSVYQKAPSNLDNISRLFDKGILAVELDEHKRHRRVLNPAFGVAQIRVITEVFVKKAVQLRDIWAGRVAQENGTSRIEVFSGLRLMTLDVIGQAGFNYQFSALENKGESDELTQVFTDLFHSPYANRNAAFRLSQSLVPILKLLPVPGTKLRRIARSKMRLIGSHIVSDAKANIKTTEDENVLGGGRRDLLSVLLKANSAANIPESQGLTDDEARTSATAWALHALSLNTAAQAKLRDELLTISTDNPTMDELNSLPYLEMVVRETMRAHAPVVFLQLMAMKDDLLPPYVDKNEHPYNSLPNPKGQKMHIPIWAINTDKEIWGKHATEFIPERWEKVPAGASAIPGVWANLFTFFAGPHNCIGFRFALVEMKALLCTLIRAFEFEAAVPKGGIGPTVSGVLQQPTVLATGLGSGLPLIVKPVVAQGF